MWMWGGLFLVGCSSVALAGLRLIPPTSQAKESLQYIKNHLHLKGIRRLKKRVGQPFAMVALSKASQGLSNIARISPVHKKLAKKLLTQAVTLALHPTLSPYGKTPTKLRRFGHTGLYLSHLAIVLGEASLTQKKRLYPALHTKIIKHLRRLSLKSRQKHLRSYRKSRHRWPADQTATLYAFWLYDKLYNKDLLQAPLQGWLRYMKRHATNKRGLHYSNVTGSRMWRSPRGCGLSWSILYLGRMAPKAARTLYKAYKRHHFVQLAGMGGFREWPRGVKGYVDNDTGPIVFGIGAAATAFGIGAARVMGDHTTTEQLQRTRHIVNTSIQWVGKRRRPALNNLLTHGITLLTDTIQPHTPSSQKAHPQKTSPTH
ncbi:MAG: hypothetical protein CL920_29020 [Deltaproteobacteria bacterium]|nr:hypothetical protein [Deltaproteobacteria bacterium]|tara:strand:+ start:1644 stop:2759 length:1116 start_codon:yes stop_codon:yes gene_type:complete